MIFDYLEILQTWRIYKDNVIQQLIFQNSHPIKKILSGVTLSNVTPPNNLLLNSYFKNLTVGLHILYVFNMHANFYINQMLFIIRFINLYFMQYFKLQKFEFKQLIDDMAINL